MSLSGTVTLFSPLAANLNNEAVGGSIFTVASVSFSDGRGTVSGTTGLGAFASFSTNALGQITGWDISVSGELTAPLHLIQSSSTTGDRGSLNELLSLTEGAIDSRSTSLPGLWYLDGVLVSATIPVSTVPLPGALPLFATGLGALGLLGWRRKRKRPDPINI